ncbi:hypothetical protein G7Y79_00107g101530 [Physcia stellaris]|nr:hypothetical protein G7Y79_00107g101530 [Physcia stellaris]
MTTPTPAATSAPDLLPFSSALCDHVPDGHPMTQDLKTLYSMHLTGDAKALRCSWFTQAKRAQESYHLRKHELEVKNKLKEEMKQLTKQKEEARLAKKRAEGYTCRRCKTKFDSNTKLHEHIRTRHAKKPKLAEQSVVSPPTPPASSPRSVTSSPPTSPKLLPLSMPAPEIVRERSESISPTSSVATPKKPISWAEIASRPVVAPKPSRLPIATPKSVSKILEKPAVCCPLAPLTPPRTPTSKHQGIQKPYLTMDDLFHMFAGKPSPFGLQPSQNKPLSPRSSGKCSPRSNCKSGPIQTRITSYFNAVALPASKSAKFEAFPAVHDPAKQSARTSPSLFRSTPRFASVRPSFPRISRSPPVCRHCQGRSATYWPTGWAMRNASRVESNGIPMGMRYWRFAPLHPASGEY